VSSLVAGADAVPAEAAVITEAAAAGPPRNEADLSKPRPSVLKRQREQVKRDKKNAKAEKRALRKTEGFSPEPEEESLESVLGEPEQLSEQER
jgi:hypothetical protein